MIKKIQQILRNKKLCCSLIIIAGLLCMVVGAVGGKFGLDFASRNSACKECHLVSGYQLFLDTTIEEHKNIEKPQEKTCASCHPDKRVWHFLHREAKEAFSFYNDFTVDPNPYSVREESETSFDVKCLTCHEGILKVDIAPPERLTDRLARIGLRPAHEIHYRFREVQPKDIERYKELKADKGLCEKKNQEFALLDKIISSSCDECHRYAKFDEQGNMFIDKTVNYAAREPLGCTACHIDAHSHLHPDSRTELTLPSRYVCRRCHQGQRHARMNIFPASCEEKPEKQNIKTCKKCHPNINRIL